MFRFIYYSAYEAEITFGGVPMLRFLPELPAVGGQLGRVEVVFADSQCCD